VAEPTLSARALNRALLHRQSLLERSTGSLTDVLEQVGGLQTQYAPAGYIGLWSRLDGFERPMLTRALEQRRAIQATLMRATIHIVSARDYWPMLAGIRRINREWYSRADPEIGATDMAAIAIAVRDALADGPLRMAELVKRVEALGVPPRAAARSGLWVDMVRVPPSGTWERRRADLYGLADQWLAPLEVAEDEGIELLIRRYLGAFGPAPLKAIGTWMGFNVGQLQHVVQRMELRTLHDEAGKPLLDLPDAPLPDPDTPAPVRFLAVWDALLLVHARRTEVLPEAYRSQIFNTRTPHSFNTFLVDGQVAGTWRFEAGEVQLTPFRTLTAAERRELDDEAQRLATFHA
jgi:hypothetical protein